MAIIVTTCAITVVQQLLLRQAFGTAYIYVYVIYVASIDNGLLIHPVM